VCVCVCVCVCVRERERERERESFQSGSEISSRKESMESASNSHHVSVSGES
jgi:hypothetical protein